MKYCKITLFAIIVIGSICLFHTTLHAENKGEVKVLGDPVYQESRYPHWAIIKDILFLFWENRAWRKPQSTDFLPATLCFAQLSRNNMPLKLPLEQVGGKITLQNPSQSYVPYSVTEYLDGKTLLAYQSDLRGSLHTVGWTLTASVLDINQISTTQKTFTFPKRSLLPFKDESIRQYMEGEHLTNRQQVIDRIGTASEEELGNDYSDPSIATDGTKHRLFAIGVDRNDRNKTDNNLNLLWKRTSRDGGISWTPYEHTNISGYQPGVIYFNNQWYVTATKRDIGSITGDVAVGYWPEEIPNRAAWPYTGSIVLYIYDAEGKRTKDSPVTVVKDKYAIQGRLAVRDDGLFVFAYVRTDSIGATSLWMTTSKDSIRWSPPRLCVKSVKLLRDVDAVFYKGDLWLTYVNVDENGRQQVMILKPNVE